MPCLVFVAFCRTGAMYICYSPTVNRPSQAHDEALGIVFGADSGPKGRVGAILAEKTRQARGRVGPTETGRPGNSNRRALHARKCRTLQGAKGSHCIGRAGRAEWTERMRATYQAMRMRLPRRPSWMSEASQGV